MKCSSAHLCLERCSVAAHVDGQDLDRVVGLKKLPGIAQQTLAVWMHVIGDVQADKVLADVAVHRRRGIVGLENAQGLGVVDDQSVAGGLEDLPIGLVFGLELRRAVPSGVH